MFLFLFDYFVYISWLWVYMCLSVLCVLFSDSSPKRWPLSRQADGSWLYFLSISMEKTDKQFAHGAEHDGSSLWSQHLWGVHGHSRIHSKFEASLDYMRPCLEAKTVCMWQYDSCYYLNGAYACTHRILLKWKGISFSHSFLWLSRGHKPVTEYQIHSV